MKITHMTLSVQSAVKKIRNMSFDLSPEYQRGPVWSKNRQSLIIDSILRGYDIPKFYIRRLETVNESYEVVDGLQRLTSMVNFMNGDFALPKGSPWAGLRYDQLPENISDFFDDFQLHFSTLEGFDDEAVRDMFLRLQNGLKLNAAEELGAVPGKMHDFVEEISKLNFFQNTTSFSSSRGANRHVAAQIALTVIRGYGDARKADLIKFYRDHSDWEQNDMAKQIKTVLNWLHGAFPSKDPVFRNRGQSVSIVTAVSELWSQFSLAGSESLFVDAIHDFDRRVIKGEPQFKDYATAISHSSDQGRSIEERREYLLAALSEYANKLPKKDSKRSFSLPMRVLAWYESGGKCQVPNCSNPITFQDFHADHIKAWANGGETSQVNLQVLCAQHNLSKGKQ